MKLSGELDYRIRYDVEHNLFHAQNVFNDEYITPTFVEYVQELEKENTELKQKLEALEGQTPWKDIKDKSEVIGKLTEAKEIIREILEEDNYSLSLHKELRLKAEAFLKE